MTESAKACGRRIHLAAHALRSVRNTALEENGIAFPHWAVLEAVTETPEMNRAKLIHRLVELTVHNEDGAAAQAIDELREKGLLATSTDNPGIIELTDQGKALAQKVIATRTDLRNQLSGDISPEDFATTTRVLEQITRRAESIHKGQ